MHDKLCFVQFIHPGGEHEPDDGERKEWNRGNHKRKFLWQNGTYVANGKTEKGDIMFWGEWEPESVVERKIDDPIPRGPRFICKPYYVVPESYDGLQNTDPFVFGQQFLYTWCQQRTKKSATQLRYLSKGSVILFGSCEDKAFVLDTVFVVDRGIDHTRADYLGVLADISQEYKEVTIFPWYRVLSTEGKSCAVVGSVESWRLYFGATYDKPVHGMYSFFPCQPYDASSRGFARPKISLSGTITDNLRQGKRYEQPTLDAMKLLWEKITEQVREQGLALGAYAEMPERRPNSASAR
jgi:hypothetical protein